LRKRKPKKAGGHTRISVGKGRGDGKKRRRAKKKLTREKPWSKLKVRRHRKGDSRKQALARQRKQGGKR